MGHFVYEERFSFSGGLVFFPKGGVQLFEGGGSSPGMIKVPEANPCRSELRDEANFPASERGPVECWALARLISCLIAVGLFYGDICRRLLDEHDTPIPDRATAQYDYEAWLTRVVERSEGLQGSTVFPDEVDQAQTYVEGPKVQRWVNAYERSREARERCIQHYGARCSICNFDFGSAYDGIVGLIHVHHLKPLSEIGQPYTVNPDDDLRPVCPNCHVVIHRYKKPFSIEEVKAMV